MRIRLPPQPKLRLVDLLRRRRMTLQDWLKENVVNTYDDLLAWCQRVRVAPPSPEEWDEMKPTPPPAPEKPALWWGKQRSWQQTEIRAVMSTKCPESSG